MTCHPNLGPSERAVPCVSPPRRRHMVIMGPSPSPSGSQWGLPLLADGPLLPPPHELRRARLIRNLRATAPIVLTAAVAGGMAVTVVERKRRRERLATGGHWHSVTQVRRVACHTPGDRGRAVCDAPTPPGRQPRQPRGQTEGTLSRRL